MTLTFLGTSDSKGVPRLWCDCAVCQEARQHGENRRHRPAALLESAGVRLLLDCGPDTHGTLSALAARRGAALMPDLALISHAHNDHLMGLGDLLDYHRYEGGALPIYAPAAVIPAIRERFGYAFRGAEPVQPIPAAGLTVGEYRLRAVEVPHGANGTSYAFRFDGPAHWMYMTDAIDVPDALAAEWLSDLDLLVLGTAFYDESAQPRVGRSLYDVQEAMTLPWVRRTAQVYFSHLSHGVDTRLPLPPGPWAFARDGQTVSLPVSPAPQTSEAIQTSQATQAPVGDRTGKP